MARQKRSSKVLEKSERRLAALKSISSTLDLGNGRTVEIYEQAIESGRRRLEFYNTTLSTADAAGTAVAEFEKSLSELSEDMLLAVAAKFGKDSPEYEMAGGVRRSERKRPTRKAKQ
ncbi:MAG: hypothetical protein HC840_18045 [Leptolyngbyaceae cyanobacterium RM2_2_4]|nr:hypothetical protein [Leptolyngbyaceae cyanobacterium SM1_4_3]NJO51031.1 hypothetical protein [Leptolyngbyaceae cyanobacterium RM2_2_4]NJO67244.1 hypothetical protein [Leptolyngbyaceae cyanobacterium RM1_405_57]